ncbi:MAG: hypothetical protein ABI877_04880 [Gemmatimonadaceae bacterium]
MSPGEGALAFLPKRVQSTGTTVGAVTSRVTPLALAALTLVCVILSIGPWPVGVFQDDGIYVVLAKSLATGEGFRFLQMPGAPNATHYPPLYPAFLAVLWKAWPHFPQNVVLFKFANAILLAITAVGTHRFARDWGKLSEPSAVLMTVAFVCCTPLMLLSVMVLSEPMFLALLIPTLIAAERALRTGRVRDAVLAGLVVGILSLVRSLGLLVAPATILALVWRRRWSAALAVALATAFVVAPWQFWVMQHAHEVPAIYLGKFGSYFGWWTQAIQSEGFGWVARVSVHNLRMMTEQGWASTSTESLSLPLRMLATVALAGFFLGGLLRLVRRLPATALFVSMYLVMVVVWPFTPARFIWGIWPLVGLCFASGVQWAWELHRGIVALPDSGGVRQRMLAFARPLLLASAASLLAGYATYNAKGVTRSWWTTIQRGAADRAQPLAEWALTNTKPTDVLVTDDDMLIYLYTGRQTVPTTTFTAQEHLVPQTPAFAAASLREILRSYHATYVMASTPYGTLAANGLVVGPLREIRIVAVLKTGAVYVPTIRPSGPS